MNRDWAPADAAAWLRTLPNHEDLEGRRRSRRANHTEYEDLEREDRINDAFVLLRAFAVRRPLTLRPGPWARI
jgi:hypothetical protein